MDHSNVTDCGTKDDHYSVVKSNVKYIFQGVLLSIIAFIGVMGNLASLRVLARANLRIVPFNQLLIALAAFDTVYLIFGGVNYSCRAFTSCQVDWYTIIFPYLVHPLTKISMCGSIFMMVAISAERFLGICFPLHFRFAKRRTSLYILPVVLISFAINASKFLETKIEWIQVSSNNSQGKNSSYWTPDLKPSSLRFNTDYITYYNRCFTIITTIIPAILLLILNAKVICDINSTKLQNIRSNLHIRREKKLFFILLSIVVTFFLCHIPRMIVDLWEFANIHQIVLCDMRLVSPLWIEILVHVSPFFTIFNSSINFVIYYLVGVQFRTEFLSSLGFKKPSSDRHLLRHYSVTYTSSLRSRQSTRSRQMRTTLEATRI